MQRSVLLLRCSGNQRDTEEPPGRSSALRQETLASLNQSSEPQAGFAMWYILGTEQTVLLRVPEYSTGLLLVEVCNWSLQQITWSKTTKGCSV